MSVLLDEERTLRSGELFAGVGGLGMAVDEVFGASPAWFAEFDDAPSKVLAHRHPEVPNYGDVTRIDFGAVPHTHIRSGGFPCQDVSLAGRRKGLAGGTRSGLWSEFLRSIEEDRPDWVVIENVRGLLSAEGEPWHADLIEAHAEMVRLKHLAETVEAFAHGNPSRRKEGRSAYARRWKFTAVRIARQRDWAVARFKQERRLVQRAIAIVLRGLADLGFDAEWTGLRASDVGAPHGRFRVFILAWPSERTVADAGSGRGRGRSVASGRGEGTRADAQADGADPRNGGAPESLTRAEVFAGDWGDWTLLPPPVAQPSGNSPEDHLRKKPGREVVTDLAIIAENGLIGSGGRLLPTPTAMDSKGSGGSSELHVTLTDAVVRTKLGTRSNERLLPTPEAKLATSGPDYARMNREGSGGDDLTTTIWKEGLHLLPTPTVGNATGGNAQRGGDRADEKLLPGLAVEAAAGRLLPTPMVGSSNPAAHGQISGDFRAAMDRVMSEVTLLPTPTASEGAKGGPNQAYGSGGSTLSGTVPHITNWGPYADAIARWEQIVGRPAPAPVRMDGKGGKPRLNPELTEWMMGWPAGHVTDPAIGLTRAEQLKACGNGVVPQQAAAALREMLSRTGVPSIEAVAA